MSQLISGKKRRAEGYSDTSHPLVYHPVPLSEFVTSRDHLSLLKQASSLEADMDIFRKHPATTNEIIDSFQVLFLEYGLVPIGRVISSVLGCPSVGEEGAEGSPQVERRSADFH